MPAQRIGEIVAGALLLLTPTYVCAGFSVSPTATACLPRYPTTRKSRNAFWEPLWQKSNRGHVPTLRKSGLNPRMNTDPLSIWL